MCFVEISVYQNFGVGNLESIWVFYISAIVIFSCGKVSISVRYIGKNSYRRIDISVPKSKKYYYLLCLFVFSCFKCMPVVIFWNEQKKPVESNLTHFRRHNYDKKRNVSEKYYIFGLDFFLFLFFFWRLTTWWQQTD